MVIFELDITGGTGFQSKMYLKDTAGCGPNTLSLDYKLTCPVCLTVLAALLQTIFSCSQLTYVIIILGDAIAIPEC